MGVVVGLCVGLVVVVGRSMVEVVVTVVVRVVPLGIVLIHLRMSRLVDTTVVVGHCRVGSEEFLETAGVFVSGQDSVMSST